MSDWLWLTVKVVGVIAALIGFGVLGIFLRFLYLYSQTH